MTPNIPPAQKEEHGNLRNQETSQERLFTDDWEEQECENACRQTILEATKLIFGNPVLTILQVALGTWRDG